MNRQTGTNFRCGFGLVLVWRLSWVSLCFVTLTTAVSGGLLRISVEYMISQMQDEHTLQAVSVLSSLFCVLIMVVILVWGEVKK